MTGFTQESNTSNISWGFNSSRYLELSCWDFCTVTGTKPNAQVLGQPVPFNYWWLLPAGSPHDPRWLDSLPTLWLPCPLFRIQKVSWDYFFLLQDSNVWPYFSSKLLHLVLKPPNSWVGVEEASPYLVVSPNIQNIVSKWTKNCKKEFYPRDAGLQQQDQRWMDLCKFSASARKTTWCGAGRTQAQQQSPKPNQIHTVLVHLSLH